MENIENTNPSLREYFGELIPDESVFSYLSQQIFFDRKQTNGNHLDYSVPFYYYDKELAADTKAIPESDLLRGFYMIRMPHVEKLHTIDELMTLTLGDIRECASIVRATPDYDETVSDVYYVAVSARRGRKIQLNEQCLYCLGVAY